MKRQKTTYCPRHPMYQAKRMPRAQCEACWALWFWIHYVRDGKKDLLDFIQWRI